MIQADDLVGTVVLVNADLPYDPLGKQDQIGFICAADWIKDDVFVDFKDKVGLYSADALLIFLPGEQIHQNLADLDFSIGFEIIKALTTVDLFLRYGEKNKERRAMEVARDNKSIRHLCLDSLKNQNALKISQSHER